MLSKRQTIKEHRKMWNWILKMSKRYNRIFWKTDYFRDTPEELVPYNNCYLCEYMRQTSNSRCFNRSYIDTLFDTQPERNETCILNWLNKANDCNCKDGLYLRCRQAVLTNNVEEFIKLAEVIANLKEM